MKYLFFITFIVVGLTACNFTKPHEKVAQEEAQQAGLSAVAKSHFDATFISPAVNFAQYKKLKVDDLDLTHVKIIKPDTQNLSQEPWELNDEDKHYYQAKYSDAVKKSLIDSGLYSITSEVGADTLYSKQKLRKSLRMHLKMISKAALT